MTFVTARESLSNESKRPAVVTGCAALDGILGGGLRRGHLTEIYGESGCGKTQIALQIACHAARDGGAVYLCTEDGFPSRRLQHLLGCAGGDGDKIFISQLMEVEDVIDCVKNKLPNLLKAHGDISVVILDSIAAPFRGAFRDASSNVTRARHIKEIGTGLIGCAKDHDAAILCINQVSANFDSETSDDAVPCLGLAWSNLVSARINVAKTNRRCSFDPTSNARRLKVVFSPNLPNVGVDYAITPAGVIAR